MTCKDCIHYEICKISHPISACMDGVCSFYKDKARFIELPCKVGAEIFILMIDDEFPNYVDLGTVKGLSYQADGVWIHAQYECGLLYWHHLEDLGKKFFFDPYEAEKALKERENK